MTNVLYALRAGVTSLIVGFSALAITVPAPSYGQWLTGLVSDTMDNWEGMPAFFDAGIPNFYALSPVSCFVAEQALVVDNSGNYTINREDPDAPLIACNEGDLTLADEDFLYDDVADSMSCDDTCVLPCDDTCVTETEEYGSGGAVGVIGGGGYGGYGGGWGGGGGGGGGFGGGSASANANAAAKAKAKVIVKINVPEPSTYLLMGGMALVVMGAMRQRKAAKGEK